MIFFLILPKIYEMSEVKISVITVVFNGADYIEETIKSVVNQDYNNLEYIIVDGKSTDGTMEIIKKYEKKISRIISEKDSGLYDAMNKGLGFACGDFVIFINCGDRFSSSGLLSEIFSSGHDFSETGVVYGDTDIIDGSGNVVHSRRHRPPQNLKYSDFLKGMLVCHQSFFARRTLCSPYNPNYKYAADYDWCLNVLKKSRENFNSEKTVSLFLEGGRTAKTVAPGLKERFKIMCSHFGFFRAAFWNVVLSVKFLWWIMFHKWY
jgi:glycosyltransferase involved in cell wall biosynthesis